jgi:hypothetical protein
MSLSRRGLSHIIHHSTGFGSKEIGPLLVYLLRIRRFSRIC